MKLEKLFWMWKKSYWFEWATDYIQFFQPLHSDLWGLPIYKEKKLDKCISHFLQFTEGFPESTDWDKL